MLQLCCLLVILGRIFLVLGVYFEMLVSSRSLWTYYKDATGLAIWAVVCIVSEG